MNMKKHIKILFLILIVIMITSNITFAWDVHTMSEEIEFYNKNK